MNFDDTRLSLRGGGWGFPLATMNVAPWYFHRKREEKKRTRRDPWLFYTPPTCCIYVAPCENQQFTQFLSPFHPYYFTGHLPSPSSTMFCYTHILQRWPHTTDFTVISTVFISGYKLILAISRDPKL